MPRATPLSLYRNIGILAHVDAGKTSLSERILFYTGKSRIVGDVHKGTATMDWMEQEQERGITISAAATTCFWRNHRLTLIDTPGHVDFAIEVERSLRVLDGGVALLDAVAGVEAQTEAIWQKAEQLALPCLCFVNKMDRIGADFRHALDSIRNRLGAKPFAAQLPLMEKGVFVGVIDLVARVALRWEGDVPGSPVIRTSPPDFMADLIEEQRKLLVEAVIEADDRLVEAYLDGVELPEEILRQAIRQAVLRRDVTLVFCGSALKNKGIEPLLDAITAYLPSPLENGRTKEGGVFWGQIFKIVHDPLEGKLNYLCLYGGTLKRGDVFSINGQEDCFAATRILQMNANEAEDVTKAHSGDIVALTGPFEAATGDVLGAAGFASDLAPIKPPVPVLEMSIEPLVSSDQERLEAALHLLALEDPSLKIGMDAETGRRSLAGMGELHLDVVAERIRREFKIPVALGNPKVAYKISISKPIRIMRSFGAEAQAAFVELELVPAAFERGICFQDLTGLSQTDRDLLSADLQDAGAGGDFAGYSVAGLEVRLLSLTGEKKGFPVKAALIRAFRDGIAEAPLVLEPVMRLEITVPEADFGIVSADINRRRGRVLGMTGREGLFVVAATAPLAALFGYVGDLRSLTQGRAHFAMHFLHDAPIPKEGRGS